jgi:trehalose 6-phosphate phosphatase
MKILNPDIDFATLREKLRGSSQKALLLDYDGTLAPFHAQPDKAFPYPGVRETLEKLLQCANLRLVMITGRWIKDLLPLLRLEGKVEIWGCHGLERLRPDGSYDIAPMDEESLQGLVNADEWTESVGLSARTEPKPGSLAIHWRGLGQERIAEIKGRVGPRWSLISEAWGLSLLEFDGGLELRVPVRNKGDAVRTILEETTGDAVVAYLGDDLTDEDGFEALKDKGIGVLVRKTYRPTGADIWIKPPEELLAFLSEWVSDLKEQ